MASLGAKKAKPKDTTVLVVELGTFFVKYAVITTLDLGEQYLGRLDLKHAVDIYSGKINYNLLSRDITRKILDIKETLGKVDKVILVPIKGDTEVKIIPRLEYQENKKKYVASMKKEFKDMDLKNHTYDWALTDDNPESDYQSVVVETMRDDLAFELSTMMVGIDVPEFCITSCVVPYASLTTKSDTAKLVIDFGHSRTRLVIVYRGSVYMMKDVNKSGADMTVALTGNVQPSLDNIKEKHETELDSYPSAVNDIINDLVKGVTTIKEEFGVRFDIPLTEYIVIGGSASLDIEKELNTFSVGMKRTYYPLPIVNDNIIPTEARNYLTFPHLVAKHDFDTMGKVGSNIDFSAPKSGEIGIQIKKVVNFYNKNKKGLYISVACLALLLVSLGYSSKVVDTKYMEVSAEEQAVTAQVLGLQGQADALTNSLQKLESDSTYDLKDTGELLRRLNEITPPKFNVSNLELNNLGDTGIITVKTESQVTVSSFLTLLQDPVNGLFQSANIVDIKIDKSVNSNIYITTIYVEGRKL